jgi:hypothetical protein
MEVLLFDQLYEFLGMLSLDDRKRLTWKLNERGRSMIDRHQAVLVERIHSLADPLNAINQWTNEQGLFLLPMASELREDWDRLGRLDLHPEERFISFRLVSSYPEQRSAWRAALTKVEEDKRRALL